MCIFVLCLSVGCSTFPPFSLAVHCADMPVLRHYSSAYKYYGAVPGAQLIVRMISTVYNYDYIQDLVLGVDGTLDVKVTTSGYIQVRVT